MATINKNTYEQTVVTAPTAPSTTQVLDMNIEAPLIRQIWQNRVVDEPRLRWQISAASSFFTGQNMIETNILFDNLRFGQQITVPIKKDQNPLGLYQSDALTYKAVGDCCGQQLDLDCSLPCVSTAPAYETLTFAFDTRYVYGVRACVATEDFYDFNWYMDQYGLSRAAKDFGREVDLWNKVIKGLIAAPATTTDVVLAAQHPTHYWSNLGNFSATTIDTIRAADAYFVNAYDVNPSIIMTREMGRKIIASVQTEWNFNATWQRVNTFQQWDVPGLMLDEQVRTILGVNTYVFFLERSNWLTWSTTQESNTVTVTRYPLWSEDLTKEYVVILDPRVGYQFAKKGPQLNIMPYDCDHMYKGMIDTEYVGSGITFPQFGIVLEFNRVPVIG